MDPRYPRMDYTSRRFADALAELLRQEAGDPHARVNLREFFGRVKGWKYETLRKQISGERTLQAEAIEAMAECLGVSPEYFQEYRRHQIEQTISDHPELVDLFYDLAGEPRAVAGRDRRTAWSRGSSINWPNSATSTPIWPRGCSNSSVEGQVSDIQAAAFLMGLRTKGETADEIYGIARTMRAFGTPVVIPCDEPLVDIVSTGGDRLATFNISTTAAFVAAGAGVRIAKHGSRGQTSHSGSADLLQALGARVDLPPDAIATCVRRVGIGFMFAPLHYQPIRHMLPMRRGLNMRTIFNFIAPILNPAGVKRQLTGVSETRYLSTLATALARLGSEHALFAHGDDGLDEISISGPTTMVELNDGAVGEPFSVVPEDFGLRRWPLIDLVGGDPVKNAEVTRRVLTGEPGGPLDVVLLNAGAAVYLSGRAASIQEGVEKARASVDSGAAHAKLTAFIDFTTSVSDAPRVRGGTPLFGAAARRPTADRPPNVQDGRA